MKTFAKFALPALAATVLSAAAATAQSRTLVLLREFTDTSYLTDWMPAALRGTAEYVLSQHINNDLAADLQALAAGRYQRFIDLSDDRCTRSNLLRTLIDETARGSVVDLAVHGRGLPERLVMGAGDDLLGATRTSTGAIIAQGNIRTLLSEARAQRGASFQFNLRLVHMTNAFGSTLNDDWQAIGAKVSIGPRRNNYMVEPQNRDFWRHFLTQDLRVGVSAEGAYDWARVVWSILPGYGVVDPATGWSPFEESRPIVAGNATMIFRDEMQLAVGQTKTFTVPASSIGRFGGVYTMAGQTYRIVATGSWQNGATSIGPNGYTPGWFDGLRRHPGNMMRLISERMARHGDLGTAVPATMFDIGSGRDLATTGSGFLVFWANDALAGYLDNSGSITVTVRRLQ